MARVFKKKQSLTSSGLYRKWEHWSEGDVLVGKLVSFVKDSYGKTGPVVEVISAEFKDKTGKDYIGKVLNINATGGLAKAIEKLEDAIGQYIQVEYNGMTEVQKGKFKGSDCHVITMDIVEIDGDEDNNDDDDL